MEIVKISSFGILPNTGELLTEKIQNAITECAKCGNRLLFETGEYRTGTLVLEDNTDIYLEDGAVLFGSDNLDDYYIVDGCSFVDAVGQERGKAFLLSYRKKNIRISGKGTINGNGAKFTDPRPFLLRIIESENISLEGVTFKDAAAWCLHICSSAYVDIRGVKIDTRVNENNDAIDIDGSRYVKIEDCDINSGDDALCMKSTTLNPCEYVTISNCRVSSGWGAFKIGTESVGDIRHISIENCHFYDVTGGGIKIVPSDGSNVEDISIKNITMVNCTGPIFIVNGERLRRYAGIGRDTYSTIKNVTIENITADVVRAPVRGFYFGEVWGHAIGGIVISGTKRNPIKNLTLKNIKCNLPGGVTEYEEKPVRYIGEDYPEFHRMDTLPAKGIYVRDAEEVTFENLEISFKESDVRRLYVEDNVSTLLCEVKEV